MKKSSTGDSPTITSTRKDANILRKNSESLLITLFLRHSNPPMLITSPRRKMRKRDLVDPSATEERVETVMVPEVVTVMEEEEVLAVKVEEKVLLKELLLKVLPLLKPRKKPLPFEISLKIKE